MAGHAMTQAMRGQMKQQLRTGQTLAMTAQLSQSIKLLAMSNIDLAAFVDAEIERNPLLERAPDEGADARDGLPTGPEDTAPENAETLPVSAADFEADLGSNAGNVWDSDTPTTTSTNRDTAAEMRHPSLSSGGLRVTAGSDTGDFSVAEAVAEPETLHSTLRGQLALMGLKPVVHTVATHIVAQLDGAGYWRESITETADHLGCLAGDVLDALKAVQSLEPAGIAARSLAECLALQLERNDRLDPGMQAVIDNLDRLAARDFPALRKASGLSEPDLLDALSEIRRLDPKPGTAFAGGHDDYICCDATISEAPDGTWAIRLNEATLPRVLTDRTYASTVSRTGDARTRTFVDRCLADAGWLEKSLDQRAQTILKVVTEIAKQQDAFLLHGIRQLRPMTLQQVADAIDMHESTVSRVTSNKYVETPRGIFELKFFFTTTIQSTDSGDAHSSESVRDRIRTLIDEETATAILSDDAIVTILNGDGIGIARRTVAKYREGMQIPSSVRRRREKRALARAAANPVAA